MISVCIITKNEINKLEKCLRALKDYPFEIVVVDTGSDDGTWEMARRYTSKVYSYEWNDDFALPLPRHPMTLLLPLTAMKH